MKTVFFKCLTAVLCFYCTSPLFADIRLPSVFSDHMVLQAETEIAVWGWADPDEAVSVEFAGQTKTVQADSSKRWKVRLDPMPVSPESRRIIVRSLSGKQTLEINDVLVGEVWLCSGQSNMAMALKRTAGAEEVIASAGYPQIRLFLSRSMPAAAPQEDCEGEWVVCSPGKVSRFSAVAYHFGRELHQSLSCSVGLIQAAMGGSTIEAWTSQTAMQSAPELQPLLSKIQSETTGTDATADVAIQKRMPAQMFNARIAPIVPYTIRGCIWYQGEANTEPSKAGFYKYQLPLLIQDWRTRWGTEFPFGWVQLPNYQDEGRDWPAVRDAMLASLKIPNTGMAVTLDIGDSKNLHPVRKKEVGERLSFWALHDVYGRADVAASGPLVNSWKIQAGEAVLSFRHVDGGLAVRGGRLDGFEITADGKSWKPAAARIAGSDVIVSHPDISAPTAVRYAWANDPPCTLFNAAGLPASPFCTETLVLNQTQ